MAKQQFDRATLVPIICARLATGEPHTVILRDLDLKVRTVNDWRAHDPEIAAQFDEARDLGYDAIAQRSRRTARGKGEADGGDSTGDVARDKLIIDTDHKLLAKWDPRRYGDKVQLADADGNKLPAHQLSDEQLLAILAREAKGKDGG
jgi:hypothetical protein